jgi:hypothetical protein
MGLQNVNNIWSTIGVFALGGVGWLVTSFVGRPFRQFFDLRSEVIHRSVLYAKVAAVKKEFPDGSVESVDVPEDEIKRLREAVDVFRDLAARMRAFALNEHLAVWFVKWRYDPWEASTALLRVSNTLHKFGLERRHAKEALERALNFRLEE